MKTALVAAIALACVLGLAMGFGYSSYGVEEQSGGFGGRKYNHCFGDIYFIRVAIF